MGNARILAICTCTCLPSLELFGATPPPGFVDTLVMSNNYSTGARNPTAAEYEPGTGNLFVIEHRDGRVRVRDAATQGVSTALALGCMDGAGERGLLGIAFDPDYLDPSGQNRYVYLFYTGEFASSGPCSEPGVPPGSRNRVSRFMESGGLLVGEEILLETDHLTSATNHNGGTVRFGVDKTLFISIGDNDTDATANPLSRDLADLRGKLLRINPDGSIPGDNPFVGQPGVREEIWAWGLRNPFRFSVDSDTEAPVIADVGEGQWEAVYVGVAGADYGYPCVEGLAPFRNCTPAPPPGSLTQPAYVYGHGNQTPPVSGNSITGGPVYRHTAFPEEYEGSYFFSDYVDGWIRRGRINGVNQLVEVEVFLPDAGSVVDLLVSPEGCLTWVGRNGQGVHETCYVGGGNGQPHAVSSVDPASGLGSLGVQFTGSGSSDPDNDTLLFAWDFDDGSPLGNQADPNHIYTVDGVYTPVLTVDDQQGAANSLDSAPPLRIVVGNRAPSPSIDEPPGGTRYDAGQFLAVSGSSTDPEEGVLGADAFSWAVVFHHDSHTHPFLGPIEGLTSFDFKIPTLGEDSTDVFYRIHLTVRDGGVPLGTEVEMASTSFLDVLPNVSETTLAVEPAGQGLQLEFDRQAATAPLTRDSVVGFPRTIGAPTPQTVGGRTYNFVSWSDTGAAEHNILTPAADTTYTASFTCVSNCGNAVPNVSITSPSDGSSFAQGASIAFAGTASDAEDGSISPNLLWTSDLDGAIGTGSSFSGLLSIGVHLVTAQVTDSGGLAGSDTITIMVGFEFNFAMDSLTIDGNILGSASPDGTADFVDDFDDGSLITPPSSSFITASPLAEGGGFLRFSSVDGSLTSSRMNLEVAILDLAVLDGAGNSEITASFRGDIPELAQFYGLGVRSNNSEAVWLFVVTLGGGPYVLVTDSTRLLAADIVALAQNSSIQLRLLIDDESNQVVASYSIDNGTTFKEASQFGLFQGHGSIFGVLPNTHVWTYGGATR